MRAAPRLVDMGAGRGRHRSRAGTSPAPSEQHDLDRRRPPGPSVTSSGTTISALACGQRADQVRAAPADRRDACRSSCVGQPRRGRTAACPAGEIGRGRRGRDAPVGHDQRRTPEPSGAAPAATNTSKETYARPGCPAGRRAASRRGRSCRSPAACPAASRPCRTARCPAGDSTSLTTSYAPTLTPPVVTTRSARTSWSSMASHQARGVVGDHADAVRRPRRRRGPRAVSTKLLESSIWPGRAARRARPARSPVDSTTTRGRGRTRTRSRPTAASRPICGGPRRVPAAQDRVARLHVLAPRGGRAAPTVGRAAGSRTLRDAAVGPLHRDDGVGAGRQRRAGHDPRGLAGAGRGRRRCCPAATSPTTGRTAGLLARRRRHRRPGPRTRPSRCCRTAAGRPAP